MISIKGSHFQDEAGRTLLLRGINLGGSSKVPFKPDGATHIRDGFFEHRDISFVGRPFPLEEADEHFSRLKEWGFNFLRFLITWEAIEHAGPGIYDEDYLDYIYAILQKAGEYGFHVCIDPHQDVWSRFSGGDGAPGWTFEAVGLDITKFQETGAAILHQLWDGPFPRMIWPTNGAKLAAATMCTLFFGGNDFAPLVHVDGEPVQEYLQRHYIEAIKQVARRVRELPNVIGYDTMNEPLSGYIGCKDANTYNGLVKMGKCPTVFQTMLLGDGYPEEIEVWEQRVSGPRLVGHHTVNAKMIRAWRDGIECIWKRHGVWDVTPDGTPRLLRLDYFAVINGREVDFSEDYYRPFANRFAREMRSVHPGALIFLECEINHKPPHWRAEDAPEIVYAPHWYDAFVLFMKQYSPWVGFNIFTGKLVFGPGRIRRSFAAQLATFRQQAAAFLGGAPVLIGEIGIPFDLDKKKAYRSGDFSKQIRAMNRNMRALEDALMSCTLWNYTADNTNAYGDQWNDEDLSIFSRDQQLHPADIHSGGRALQAVVRPYARAVAGEPLRMGFDMRRKIFEFEFRHDASISAPTVLFVPNYQYPRGYTVEVSDGSYEIDRERQVVEYRHTEAREIHKIRVIKLH
ncbi:MAG TPA: cellulase family glycosylhydrolase [Ktedonobacteraceae bacterium]|nr:cellulase family glycosylhydrolase [Ktedonobacteraceae bacterium]